MVKGRRRAHTEAIGVRHSPLHRNATDLVSRVPVPRRSRLSRGLRAVAVTAVAAYAVAAVTGVAGARAVAPATWSDALWLCCCGVCLVGVLALVRSSLLRGSGPPWIDAAIGSLAFAAIGAALVLQPLVDDDGAGASGFASDLVDSLLAARWAPLLLVIALVAWQTPNFMTGARVRGWESLVATICFAAVGLTLTTYDHWHGLGDIAVVLATLTLLAAFVRAAMTFAEMRTLAHGRELSMHRRLILDAAGEGIVGTDEDGTITFANPAAARMTGYEREELTGRDLHMTMHHTRADGSAYAVADCPMHRSLREQVIAHCDADVYWRRDGTSFPVEFTTTPIVERGRTQGAVVVFRDIAERLEIARVKDQLTSVVSHELRTPLTAIRGSLGLLESGALGPLPERGRRMIEIAVQNTERLVRLINDILDLERIDSGAIELVRAPCDAEQLIGSATDAVLPMAVEAGVTLAVHTQPAMLAADADRLVQTLTNLISNAVKFSAPGSTVQIHSERRDGEMLFAVTDHGRGVPADKLETIFERFEQVDASDSRSKGGTGLGLSICRSIVEQHGGRIWAQSAPGEGCTLTFVVPVAACDGDAPLDGGPAHAAVARDDAFTVLIVEDDPEVAAVLSAVLEHRGVESAAARGGSEALELGRKRIPDLIALRAGLPDVEGIGIVEWLRRYEPLSAVPIVVYAPAELMQAERSRRTLGFVTTILTKTEVSAAEFERRMLELLAPPRTPRAPAEALT